MNMKRVNNNFGRFYALIKNLPGHPSKEEIVRHFTKGRTTHLSDLTRDEYNWLCDSLPDPQRDALKKAGSAVLKRMQQLGVDTSDWANIDNFCMNPRIAGKVFRHLTLAERKALVPKLESMIAKKRAKEALLATSTAPAATAATAALPIEQAPSWTLDVYSRFPGCQNVN